MVEFVLDQARQELVGLELDLVAVEVPSLHADLLGTHHLEVLTRNRQATLLERPLVMGTGDLRVHQHLWAGIVTEVVDEEPLPHPDLRRGEAQPGRVVHGGEHVLCEFDQVRVDVADLLGPASEHRVTGYSYRLPRGHGPKGTVARVSQEPHPRGASHGEPGAGAHYFDESPSSTHRPRTVELVLPDLRLEMVTDSGVFSPGRIDPGTQLLLDRLEGPGARPVTPGDIVDVGAGYGPIAVVAALRNPDRVVWAVEPNERARALCAANAESAGVASRVRVVAPGGVPDGATVAAIISNPPIRVGKPALHDILGYWLRRLEPGGAAWLVVQKHLGSDSLAGWLRRRGCTVRRLCSRRGYRVLEVTGDFTPE